MKKFNEEKLLDNMTIYKLQLQLRATNKYIKILEAQVKRWQECEFVTESICGQGSFSPDLCDNCKKIITKTAYIKEIEA